MGQREDAAAATPPFPGTPVLVEVPAGTAYARIYDQRFYADGARFRHFGPHRHGRFDHHPPGAAAHHEAHGVLYASPDVAGAVAEVFGDAMLVEGRPELRLAVLALVRPVRLADTRGLAAVELGHPAGALHSRDRPLTQGVARALYAATDADGVLYEGWFTGQDCVCLWERARPAVELVDDRGLDDPLVAADVLVAADALHYRVGRLGPF